MDKGAEMQRLLDFVSGKIFPYSKGILTYPDSGDDNQKKIHTAMEVLRELGHVEVDKVHIYSSGGNLLSTFLWMPK